MNKDIQDRDLSTDENEGSVFHIKQGQEHSPQINPDILDKSDLMYPAYTRALRALHGILKSSDKWHHSGRERTQENPYPGQFRRNMELYEYSSNIIAFCGGRGQGKTSVMRSFADALRKESFPRSAELKGMDYVYPLPTIDPSILEDKDSIMAIILSNLFYEAEYQWNHPSLSDRSGFYQNRETGAWFGSEPSLYNEPGKSGLMRQFKHCFEEVRELQKSSIGGADSLDELYEIGDSLDLKSDFFRLLGDFFRLLGKDPKKSFLLVQLDDTDLQFKKAYDVLEEIRKCLSLPNVIIVMATDIDQLRFLVAQHYYKDLEIAVQHKEVDSRDVRKMAAKYLDKLIPATNAVYLPTILTSQTSFIQITYESGRTGSPEPLQKFFYDLIYEKTGLIFIQHRDYLHSIIPRTLRGLQHLYRLLDTMPEPEPAPVLTSLHSDDTLSESAWREYCEKRLRRVTQMQKNLLQFEDYFFSDWCSSRLIKEYWDFLWEIRQAAIPSRVVAYIASHFQDVLEDENSSVEGKKRSEKSDKLSPAKLTYKALNDTISAPEQLDASQDDYALGFALHTYLSIQFNKRALDIQITALKKQVDRLKADDREKFNEQYRDTPKTPDEQLFFFNYKPIQEMLAPQVFDSKKIQRNGILRYVKSHATEKSSAGLFRFEISDFPDKLKKETSLSSSPVELSKENLYPLVQQITGIKCELQTNPLIRTIPGQRTYVDFLHFFYNALFCREEKTGDVLRINDQSVVLNMQDAALYVCCNWDVQDQIIKTLQNAENVRKYQVKGKNVFEYISKFERGKDSVEKNKEAIIQNCTDYVRTFFSHIFSYLYEKGAPYLPDAESDIVRADDFVSKCIYCPMRNSNSEPELFFYTGVILMKPQSQSQWRKFENSMQYESTVPISEGNSILPRYEGTVLISEATPEEGEGNGTG